MTTDEIDALRRGLWRMRKATRHLPESSGRLWPNCDACVLDAALVQHDALAAAQQEIARLTAERLAFATAHAEAESYTAQLREALKKSVAGQQKAEADAARLREALKELGYANVERALAPPPPSTAQETRE